MPYVINNSRNQLIAVVQDGTINTTATSQALVGKNVSPYGAVEMENLVHQLENFANSDSPVNPIVGQLWFDTATNILNVYTITNVWKPVRATTVSATAPTTSPAVGDLWFDTVARQLKIYDIIGGTASWLPSTKVAVSAIAPTAVIAGELYFDIGLQQLFVFNGSTWVSAGSGSGISSVGIIGGGGIAVSGSPLTTPGNITVTNTGVVSLTAGTGVAVNQSNGAVTVTNTGVTNVTTGTGIATTSGTGSIALTNTGVTNVAVGTGIATTSGTGSITLTNTGVTNVAVGTGIATTSSTGAITLTNTGVVSLAAGNGVSVNQSNGAVTVTNTGVVSLAAGNGVSVNQSNGAVTVTNTGVTGLQAGNNISINQSTGTVTISATITGQREIVSAVTTTLAPDAEIDLDITNGAATYALLQVGSEFPARIRIYSSDTARTADAARTVGTDPLPGSGVIAEVITFTGLTELIPGANLTQNITPGVIGFTEDASNTIPLRITNDDVVNRTITVSLRLLKMEV